MPEEQLFTVRYEDLVARPRRVAAEMSRYLDADLSRTTLSGLVRAGGRTGPDPAGAEPAVGAWRDRLTPRQLTQVEKVAGTELQRLGYRLSTDA